MYIFIITIYLKDDKEISFQKESASKEAVIHKLHKDTSESEWVVFDNQYLVKTEQISYFAVI